jgi:chemotaxis protein MotA
MNFSSFFGMIIAVSVLYFGVFIDSPNKLMFLNSHALILVLGGTCAAALISYPTSTLKNLVRFSLLGFLFKVRRNDFLVATQILEVHFACQSMQIGPKTQIDENFHPFLGEGLALLKRRKFSKEELEQILDSRIHIVKKTYMNDAKIIKALAKFPPALGLLGTTAGAISMMTQLQGDFEQIGPMLAGALVSTFWGLALSHLMILPLADYAIKVGVEEVHTREMIAKAVVMIEGAESSHVLFEKVAGYLPIAERRKYRQAFKELALTNGDPNTTNWKSDAA